MRQKDKTTIDTSKDNAVENWEVIFKSTHDLITILDIDNRILDANPAVSEATGLREDQIIGHHCYSLFHCTEKPACDCPYEKLKKSLLQESFAMEMEALGRKYLVTVSPVFDDESGRVTRVVHIAKDITKLKMTEAALTVSEKKFHGIFQSASDGILLADTVNKKFIDANKAICKMLGYTRDEILQLKVSDIHPHQDMPRVIEVFEKQVKGEVLVASELPVKRKDGSVFYADISSNTMVVDEKQCLIGIFRDSTPRLKAEKLIRKEKESARKYLDIAGVMLAVFNRDGVITLINQKGCEILNVTEDEALGKNWFEHYLPQKMVAEVKGVFNKIMSGDIKPVEYYENPVLTSDGDERIIAFHNTLITDEKGNITGVLFSGNDITDQKKAEQEKVKLEKQLLQAQKMEALGTMAGGIAHDFNNILAIIIGYADLAREATPVRSQVRENIEEVLKAADRAKILVKQILAFSRHNEQRLIPVKPQDIVNETIILLRSTIPATIEIRQDIHSQCGVIAADPTQIHQILMNLCTNAVHAMDEKGLLTITLREVTLEAEALKHRPEMTPGIFVQLSIGDTGTGIDARILDRIFDPFFTTKDVGQGTGLGLAMVHGIVNNHKGMITIENEVGTGTIFNIFFPQIEKMALESVDNLSPLPVGNERILLIDDEPSIADFVSRILDHQGYKVTVQTSSLAALKIFKSDPENFDLVITDQTMPKMSGAELAVELLKIRPDMPIILCTGFSSKISEKKAKESGIKEFMMKPLDRRQLANAVRKVLDEKIGRGSGMDTET